MNYVAAVNQGDDGRPDFHARKACNYAEQAIQVVLEFHGCCSLLYCFFATHSIDLKHTFLAISWTQGCGNLLPGACFTQEQVRFGEMSIACLEQNITAWRKEGCRDCVHFEVTGVPNPKLGHFEMSCSHFVGTETNAQTNVVRTETNLRTNVQTKNNTFAKRQVSLELLEVIITQKVLCK